MDSTYEMLSLDIFREINRIPEAKLVLDDVIRPREIFRSATPISRAGQKNRDQIAVTRDRRTKPFSKDRWCVTGWETAGSGSVLSVELKDAAVKLSDDGKSAVFREKSDHEISVKSSRMPVFRRAPSKRRTQACPDRAIYRDGLGLHPVAGDIQGLVAVTSDGEISCKRLPPADSPS